MSLAILHGYLEKIKTKERWLNLLYLVLNWYYLFMREHKKNNTAREAIQLVKKWLNNESSVTKQELRSAAYAAADAVAAADAYDIKKQINDKLINIINSIK